MNLPVKTFYDDIINRVTTCTPRTHTMLLLGVILIGFTLRLHGLLVGEGFREFAIHDEISAFRVALAFLAGEPEAWYLGQPIFSGGYAPGPAWTLFWVAIYKLGGSTPQGAMFIMLSLNTLVIYLVYRLAKNFVGRDFALLTALLFATGPWPMFYSSALWNPIPMALIGVLLYLSLWDVTQRDQSRAIFFVCIVAAVIPHFHMIGLFYYPAILFILYLGKATLNKKWFALGIVAGICVYMPYMIGEITNNWQNTQDIFSKSVPRSYGALKIITTPIGVLSNQIGRWTGYAFSYYKDFGNNYFGSYIFLVAANLVSLIISLTFFISFFIKVARALRGHWLSPKAAFEKNPAPLFIGILLVIPPLFFILTGHNYGSRYSIITLPLLFILPALFLSTLNKENTRHIFNMIISFMVFFNVYLFVIYNYHLKDVIDNADYYAPSFNKLEQTHAEIRKYIDPDVFIRIDPTDYITDTPEPMYIGGVALAGYIDTAETYLSHVSKPIQTMTLYLSPAADVRIATDRVIYQANGMAVIDRL